MLKETVQSLLGIAGLSVHRKGAVERLLKENQILRAGTDGPLPPAYLTTEDYNSFDKMKRIVDHLDNFGDADFAELSGWIFASSLLNHRIVHQRIDEGSLLWRAVKMAGGPILEVGRAAGGSTLLLLGASGTRPVVSIDRAPFHAHIAKHVFSRPDVSRRLRLYEQTSREPISESEFGLMFIDADHSYEGVCHDIATFWNQLKSFDGRPPLAAFHDAADNPINWVADVKRACAELLAERGVARVVETWGSMLVVEKIGDIDPDRWFTKENSAFWKKYATAEYPVLKPTVVRGKLHPDRPTPKLGAANLLGDKNVEDESWTKRGVTVRRPQLDCGDDNPTRLVLETPETGEHAAEISATLNLSRCNFSAFLRPHQLDDVRLAILSADRRRLAHVDFRLGARSQILKPFAEDRVQITSADFSYRNGYFGCNLAVDLGAPAASATFSVSALATDSADARYPGREQRGFFINLASVREVL